MTFTALKTLLHESQLFSAAEVEGIIHVCVKATIGNAIIACFSIGIDLTGNDIDVLFNMLNN